MSLPLTLTDAIAAINDGSLGIIEVVSISAVDPLGGSLVVSALMELSGSDELDITSKPIESGLEITDAAIDVPTRREMVICLANPDFSIESGITAALTGAWGGFTDTWRDKKNQLYKFFNDREILNFNTHEAVYTSFLIQSIEPLWDVDENWDAFFARVAFKKIVIINDVLAGLTDAAEEAGGGL